MRYCSVDPGKKGAIAFFEDDKLLDVKGLPHQKNGAVDAVTIFKWMTEYEPKKFFIERAYIPYGIKFANGYTQMMWNFGRLLGLSEMKDLQPNLITPMEWKRGLKLTSDKKKSIKLCKTLYPEANLKRTVRSQDCDGLAEAILIGHYCYTEYREFW